MRCPSPASFARFMIRRRRRQHHLGEINTFAFALELQQRVQPLVEQESLFERQFP
jgi:hypothetical protein